MDPKPAPPPRPGQTPGQTHGAAVEHVFNAHDLLQSLRQRIGEHPELEQAIVNLETALSILTVKTGGML